MAAKRIGYRDFVDGTRRAVFVDEANRQFVLGDEGEREYGVWLRDAEVVEPTKKSNK
jgi:hypothetical protein